MLGLSACCQQKVDCGHIWKLGLQHTDLTDTRTQGTHVSEATMTGNDIPRLRDLAYEAFQPPSVNLPLNFSTTLNGIT